MLMNASCQLLGQLPALGPKHAKQQRMANLLAAAAALGAWVTMACLDVLCHARWHRNLLPSLLLLLHKGGRHGFLLNQSTYALCAGRLPMHPACRGAPGQPLPQGQPETGQEAGRGGCRSSRSGDVFCCKRGSFCVFCGCKQVLTLPGVSQSHRRHHHNPCVLPRAPQAAAAPPMPGGLQALDGGAAACASEVFALQLQFRIAQQQQV